MVCSAPFLIADISKPAPAMSDKDEDVVMEPSEEEDKTDSVQSSPIFLTPQSPEKALKLQLNVDHDIMIEDVLVLCDEIEESKTDAEMEGVSRVALGQLKCLAEHIPRISLDDLRVEFLTEMIAYAQVVHVNRAHAAVVPDAENYIHQCACPMPPAADQLDIGDHSICFRVLARKCLPDRISSFVQDRYTGLVMSLMARALHAEGNVADTVFASLAGKKARFGAFPEWVICQTKRWAEKKREASTQGTEIDECRSPSKRQKKDASQ